MLCVYRLADNKMGNLLRIAWWVKWDKSDALHIILSSAERDAKMYLMLINIIKANRRADKLLNEYMTEMDLDNMQRIRESGTRRAYQLYL